MLLLCILQKYSYYTNINTVLLAIINLFFDKNIPKILIDKNTPIYCQNHTHYTFASRKNAMYPIQTCDIYFCKIL